MQALQPQSCHSFVRPNVDFQIVPLLPFGAEIVGFNPTRTATELQIDSIRNALLAHKMLIIRGRSLTPDQQIALTRIFGSELHKAGPKQRFLPDHPEIFRITNRPGEGNSNTGQYWHSDGHYLAHPSPVSVMHIVRATTDGATLVADSAAAYERLPEITREFMRRHGFMAPETGMAHPIVGAHPHTGRLGLYVNLKATAIDVKGRKIPVVNELIDLYISRPGTFYQHGWLDGDTMIIDNFAVTHRGTASNPANLRVMHRTTVTGASVWWQQQP